jgi:hypothetical protein
MSLGTRSGRTASRVRGAWSRDDTLYPLGNEHFYTLAGGQLHDQRNGRHRLAEVPAKRAIVVWAARERAVLRRLIYGPIRQVMLVAM